MPPEHKALVPKGADKKWRFFHRIGPRPLHTQFAELNSTPVIPKGTVTRLSALETH